MGLILPTGVFACPVYTVKLSTKQYVLPDPEKNLPVWLEQQGKVLQKYGEIDEETMCKPFHIEQNPGGQPCALDWANNSVHLITLEGALSRRVLTAAKKWFSGTPDRKAQKVNIGESRNGDEWMIKVFAFTT